MTSDTEFGWTKFYQEFADKLLEHKDDRTELVAKVRDACNSRGFHSLDRHGAVIDGKLPDICPFTAMGTFNRGITEASRREIAEDLGGFLGVREPAPAFFGSGIPTLNNLNSVIFFEFKDVDLLWRTFAAAIELADSDNVHTRQSFVDSYDLAVQAPGVGTRLTIGLYWIRPNRFPSLDSKSREYMTNALGIEFAGGVPPHGLNYLALADSLQERFRDPAFPVHSFQELALKAYDPQAPPPPCQPPSPSSQYTVDNIIKDGCFIERTRLKTIVSRLRLKKNLILQGPPGTGKTWLARKLAFALIGEMDDRRVRRLQFHPSLSYEDFIRGFRPSGDGTLTLVDGPFLEAVKAAEADSGNNYVLVIEEINRGNPAQIFGETLTLMEADKRSEEYALALAYPKYEEERVHLPPNLHIIGTMNVADRSIAMVDLALRRRFAFVDLEPTFGEVWRNWVNEQCGIPLGFLEEIERKVTRLNEQIAADRSLGPQFRVGHSVVTPPGKVDDEPADWFRQVVETEIGPLLDEYWFDATDKAASAKDELLANL